MVKTAAGLVLAVAIAGCAPAPKPPPAAPRPTTAPAPAQQLDAPAVRPQPVAPATAAPREPEVEELGPPAWWNEEPTWNGERVRACASATAPVLADARRAALDAGRDVLRRQLGRDAEAVNVERTYVHRDGGGYRVYVLVSGQ